MATALDIEKVVCPHCYAVLDVADNFCRHCGQGLRPENTACQVAAGAAVPAVPGTQRPKLIESRGMVLLMLFVVLGPLGLPVLWRSRQFSLLWKIALTTVMLGVTVLIISLMWYVLHKSLEPLTELHKFQGL